MALGEIWTRRYSGGIVLVNPSGADGTLIPLGDTYVDPDLGEVDELRLDRGRGRVLVVRQHRPSERHPRAYCRRRRTSAAASIRPAAGAEPVAPHPHAPASLLVSAAAAVSLSQPSSTVPSQLSSMSLQASTASGLTQGSSSSQSPSSGEDPSPSAS